MHPTFVSSGTLNHAASELSKPNFAVGVSNALEMTGDVVSRLGRLADRLCGTEPTAADSRADLPFAAGVFGAVEGNAYAIRDLMDQAMSHLSRIEGRLPSGEL